MALSCRSPPKHYLEQFHAKYNPDVDELVQQEGLEDWVQLFFAKGGNLGSFFQNAEVPTLNPWVMTTPFGDGTQYVAERNPYYWKVDPEGNQLPYIDQVTFQLVQDPDILAINAANGEIDMQTSIFNTNINKPILADNMERGNYHFIDVVPTDANTLRVVLNLTHENPTLREIFQNKDFRIALSHAINRPEMINLIFAGQGEPWQIAPRPDSPFYDEELAKQYTEYDPERARELLDEVLPETDSEGFRLTPEGDRLSFVLEYPTGGEVVSDAMELLVQYWQDVGIDVQGRPQDPSLWNERRESNQIDAIAAFGGGPGLYFDVLFEPNPYFPFGSESSYAFPWGVWYVSGGESGMEPPAAAQEQMSLFDQVVSTADVEEQNELMRQMIEIAQEEFYQIGVSLPTAGYGLVKNNVHNVPDTMWDSFFFGNPGAVHPEQFFISEE